MQLLCVSASQRLFVPGLLCVLSALSAPARAQNAPAAWAQFRGPDASGVAATTLPTAWDVKAGRNILWRVPIPGLSHSSPIVWGDRIYLLTAVPLVTRDLQLKTGEAGIVTADDLVPHAWKLYAIDRKTGGIVWERTLHEGTPRTRRHVKASHASSTPATDGSHIVVLAGTEGLYCYDTAGKLLWKRDLGVLDVGMVDDPTYQWGPASSPILYEGLVIVQNDRQRESALAAYDLKTGAPVWQSPRDEMPSWATPLLYRGARTELVTNSPKHIRGHDPKTGRELWRLPDNWTQVKVPSPIVAGDVIVVSGGYPSAGRPIYAVKPGSSGEIAPAQLAWRTERGSPYTPTPIAYGDLLYSITDNGILSAYRVTTGERLYQTRIAPSASAFSASPVAAGGRLYFASEDGDVFVVQSGPEFKLLATNSMGEICMATPAIVDGMLIVRTRTQLVAIAERSATSAQN